MNWEDAIPSIAIAQAARATEPAMDSDQFAAFYERSAKPLWAYLARASGNAALADDLMQESYVRFLCAGFPGDGEVAGRRYLFRIASNLLRDYWRRPRALPSRNCPRTARRARHVRANGVPPDALTRTGQTASPRPPAAMARSRGELLAP